MTRCPVCKLSTGFYYWLNAEPNGPMVRKDHPLYQRSYEGSDEYISPRCLGCYNKAEARTWQDAKRRQDKTKSLR